MRYLLIILCFFVQSSWSQLKTYSFSQLDSLQVNEPKPVVVFLHTNWCKYCTLMNKSTLTNSKVIEELNTRFYFISFDAESREDICFNGVLYSYEPLGMNKGTHALVKNFNISTYPGFVFLNPRNDVLVTQESYFTTQQFLQLLALF